MKKEYDLDYLINEFEKHAHEFENSGFCTENDFNLPLAMHILAKEIKKLKPSSSAAVSVCF